MDSAKEKYFNELYIDLFDWLVDIGHYFTASDPELFREVEDAVQETFLIAWKKADEIYQSPHIHGWLIVTLRNILRTKRRELKKNGKILTISLDDENSAQFLDQLQTPSNAEADLMEKEYRRVLTDILGEENANLFWNVRVEGLPLKNVAEKAGISVIALKTRISRIRKELRKFSHLFLFVLIFSKIFF